MDLTDFYLNERSMEMHVTGARREAQVDRILKPTIVDPVRQQGRASDSWLCELNYRLALAGEWLAQYRPLRALGAMLQDVRLASACG